MIAARCTYPGTARRGREAPGKRYIPFSPLFSDRRRYVPERLASPLCVPYATLLSSFRSPLVAPTSYRCYPASLSAREKDTYANRFIRGFISLLERDAFFCEMRKRKDDRSDALSAILILGTVEKTFPFTLSFSLPLSLQVPIIAFPALTYVPDGPRLVTSVRALLPG